MRNTYLAVDFGGGSGRVIAGNIIDGRIVLDEIHRFPNRQIKLGKTIYWDFLFLFEEMKSGLRKAAQKEYKINGIGIDTWGVDFGLIDKNGDLLSNPVCYRDSRTDGIPQEVFQLLDEEEHYMTSGIQVMSINTLFQLYSMKKNQDVKLTIADHLLFMPDLFSYYLTGIANNEYCISSTSELLNAANRSWDIDLIKKLELPVQLFGEVVLPGTIRGKLLPEVAEEVQLSNVDVIAVGSHDTASAVVAIPSMKKNIAFLSSGTWSLFGTIIDEPILSAKARNYGFTNEGGINGSIRFLQNITGLWILQQLMQEWEERGEGVSFDEIIPLAAISDFHSRINVDDSVFLHPISMEKAILKYCEDYNLPLPDTKAEFVRCIIESLAFRYKVALEQMNECLVYPIEQLHIIGGGSQNELLNQLTADYTGIPVYAGPVEATAIGNILVQAMAKKEITSIEDLKNIAIASAVPKVYYSTN